MRIVAAALLIGCSMDANVARIPTVVIDAGVDASTKCPQKAGTATMIDLGDFCIDATETTREQYAAFLAASPTNIPGGKCVTNATFAPRLADMGCSTFDITRDPDHPMVCVDWCDAAAYCAWAGKRLCGAFGGGSEPYDDLAAYNDVTKSEWYAACAGGGTAPRKYPYGDTWRAGACTDNTIGKSAPVGARDCHGPPGTPQAAVYDMSGNVYEWVNSCRESLGGDPSLESCFTRGGFFRNEDATDAGTTPWMACAATKSPPTAFNSQKRDYGDDHIGIRCCAR